MKPILFNTDMVRAILDNRKTVTRRVVKPQPLDRDDCKHEMQTFDRMLAQYYKGDYSCVCRKCGYGVQPNGNSIFQPPYRPGDILYVRETWTSWSRTYGTIPRILYKADRYTDAEKIKWRPSIHMPSEVARIFLRVTDVWVERLQDITAAGCIAEGIYWEDVIPNVPSVPDNPAFDMDAVVSEAQEREERKLIRENYRPLWNSTIKPKDRALYGWEANPWVWAIKFERCEKPQKDD